MSGQLAARMGDQVSHTDAAFGFGLGGAVGIAAGIALLTVATGGADLLVLAAAGGAVAMAGGGALAGMKIGSTYGAPSGDIVSGSASVIINGRLAARALADTAVCDNHSGPMQIATGSTSVFFNTMPAARLGDLTVCDAKISTASSNVIIGGGTASYASVNPEVPALAVTIARDMAIGGAAVALGAGGAAAYASAGLAGLGVFGLQAGAGFLGGVAGGAVGGAVGQQLGGARGEAWGEAVGGVAGGAGGGLAGDELAGASGAKYAANQNVAQDFYSQQGWPQSRIDSHMAGIDFNQPVSVVNMPAGSQMSQWQTPGGPQGNYFAPSSETPGSLGISSVGYDPATGAVSKTQTNYVSTEPTQALSSTAAPVEDTWSNPYSTAQTPGGGQQYFVPNKGAFVPSP